MTPERYEEAGRLYHAALEIEPEARAAFLDGACGGDEELRREAESLLRAHDRVGDYFAAPALEIAAGLVAGRQNLSLAGQSLSHYRVLSLIGTGGMGEVYLAEDTRLGRKVALKLLPKEFTEDPDRVRRFELEARAASSLNHPNIVTIFEIGQVDGRHFIGTEYIEGQTLRERLSGAQLEVREALDVAAQIASALEAAHEAGIVHRDIKPENVIVRRDGLVKVLDFGLAKLTERGSLGAGSEAMTLMGVETTPGLVLGTVSYMSPEQARGLTVDARSDNFSLGVVMYEMVAGRCPFEAATASDVMAAILQNEPLPLARFAQNVPGELKRIVAKALRKDREERYQTASELSVDLKSLKQELEVEARLNRSLQPDGDGMRVTEEQGALSTGDVGPARTTSSAEVIISEIKRHKRSALLVLAAFVVVIAGIPFGLYKWIGHESATPLQLKITRLTSTGRATRAAISPDGKYVAYVKDEAGQRSLWLIQVATASDEQIVPPTEARYYGVTFSHDGNFIYYVVVETNSSTGVLYLKPVLGGAGRKLIANVDSRITLSPDGKRLAFVRIIPPFREYVLMVANVDGTEEKRVAVRKPPEQFTSSFDSGGPAWSPDGKVIACGSRNFSGGFYADVVGVRVADLVETPITSQRWYSTDRGEGSPAVGHVAWLPNGSGLVVVATEHSGSLAQLWQLSYRADDARRISNDLSGYDGISLTTDSGTLATVRVDRLVNIWVAPDGDASRAKQLTTGAGREDGEAGLAWTPDGRIVYRSIAGGTPNIWIVATDGTGNKQLSVDAPNNSHPAVSPDGRYVVWGSDRAGLFNIWRMDIDGSNYKQITSGPGEWFPQISPDGRWLIYRVFSAGISNSLWKRPIDGGEPIRLTGDIGFLPSLSPDGKLIACNYRNEASTKWQMAIIPFEGGTPRFIDSSDPWSYRHIHWTPDGRAIAYAVTRGGVSNLWSEQLDGGPPKQITDFRDGLIFDFAWSRDGKQLALSRGEVNSDVVLMSGYKAK